MLLDLRSLYEVQGNSGSATFDVTVPEGTGTVVNPAPQAIGNGGVIYKSKPRPEPYQLPRVPAPRQRVYGTGRVELSRGPAVRGVGTVGRYVIGAIGEATFSVAQVRAHGDHCRRRVEGRAQARMSVARARGVATYDRSLWDQIEDEDQWLADVIKVIGVAS